MNLLCRIRVVSILCMLAAALLTGCTQNQTTDKSLVFVDASTAQELVVGKSSLLGLKHDEAGAWIDPRTEAEYVKGHVPGAIHMPLSKLVAEHETLRAYSILIVYGSDYNDPFAIGASKRLIELEHADVRTLRGGMREWTTAGNKVETGNAPASKAK